MEFGVASRACSWLSVFTAIFCFVNSAVWSLAAMFPRTSTLGRFRMRLVEHDLWERLLGEINCQLEAKNIIMTEGRVNTIDATPVEAA